MDEIQTAVDPRVRFNLYWKKERGKMPRIRASYLVRGEGTLGIKPGAVDMGGVKEYAKEVLQEITFSTGDEVSLSSNPVDPWDIDIPKPDLEQLALNLGEKFPGVTFIIDTEEST